MAKRQSTIVSTNSEASSGSRAHWWAALNLIFAAVVAAAAIGQWWVTSSQLAVMSRGLNQTDQIIKQMQLDQRPWLLPAYANVDFSLEKDPTQFGITVKNYGNTPAFITEYTIGLVLGKPGTDVREGVRNVKSRLVPQNVLVSPQSEATMLPNQDTPFDKYGVKAITEGAFDLYLIAVFEYNDPSGMKCSSLFTMKYDRHLKQFVYFPRYQEFN